MANTQTGKVPIELDRPRNLLFDFNASAEFEEEYGKPLMAVLQPRMADDQARRDLAVAVEARQSGRDVPADVEARLAETLGTRFGFREIRALLWAGLLHEDPTLTVRDAGTLMAQLPGEGMNAKLLAATEPITKALRAAFGIDEDKDVTPEKKLKPSAGLKSKATSGATG